MSQAVDDGVNEALSSLTMGTNPSGQGPSVDPVDDGGECENVQEVAPPAGEGEEEEEEEETKKMCGNSSTFLIKTKDLETTDLCPCGFLVLAHPTQKEMLARGGAAEKVKVHQEIIKGRGIDKISLVDSPRSVGKEKALRKRNPMQSPDMEENTRAKEEALGIKVKKEWDEILAQVAKAHGEDPRHKVVVIEDSDEDKPPSPRRAKGKGNAPSPQTLLKLFESFPKWSPDYNINKTMPLRFLTNMKYKFLMVTGDDEDWTTRTWPTTCISMNMYHEIDARWCQDHLAGKRLSWDEACTAFTKHFTTSAMRQQEEHEYDNMKQESKETLRGFIAKFKEKLLNRGFDASSSDLLRDGELHKRYIKDFLSKINSDVAQAWVAEPMHGPHSTTGLYQPTIGYVMEAIEDMETRREGVRIQTASLKGRGTTGTGTSATLTSTSAPSSSSPKTYDESKIKCHNCGQYGHKKINCTIPTVESKETETSKTKFVQKKMDDYAKSPRPPNSVGGSQRNTLRELTCNHCKAKGHLEDECWTKHPEKRPANNKPRVTFAEGAKANKLRAPISRPDDQPPKYSEDIVDVWRLSDNLEEDEGISPYHLNQLRAASSLRKLGQ
jgi:hypothetical protein